MAPKVSGIMRGYARTKFILICTDEWVFMRAKSQIAAMKDDSSGLSLFRGMRVYPQYFRASSVST
jgi:hypothetical protein